MNAIGCNSFIQTDFTTAMTIKHDINTNGQEYKEDHGRFELVVLEPSSKSLSHFIRDSFNELSRLGRPPGGWMKKDIISNKASSPGSIIQNYFPVLTHGNFEVIVQEGNELVHYWLDNLNPNLGWQRNNNVISTRAAGTASIIQSDFPNQQPCNFEVVSFEQDNKLVHYYRENITNPPGLWKVGQTISTKATGPGCIIQSDFKSRDRNGISHGNFIVVVPEDKGLLWYQRRWDRNTWECLGTITTNATGPGCIIQSDFKADPTLPTHNFELVVPEGNYLTHYWHDNININNTWNRDPVPISTCISGAACLIKSDYKVSRLDNRFKRIWPFCDKTSSSYTMGNERSFDVITQECTQSVVHYWRGSTIRPWERDFFIILSESYYHPETLTHKIAQLTGDIDLSTGNRTLNLTGLKYGIYGTDLGSSFLHKGMIYFLFGDTRRNSPCGQPPGDDLWDRIVFTSDTHPSDNIGISLQYHGIPLVSNICQQGSEVPIEGVSFGENIYVFFGTDSDSARNPYSMRTIVARSDGRRLPSNREVIDFGNSLYIFSNMDHNYEGKFINVSVEIVQNDDYREVIPKDIDTGKNGLFIWGSGRVRASDVFLAYMPLGDIGKPTSTGGKPGTLRYFAGKSSGIDRPKWERDEAQAIPLFKCGCVGELCVRWNKFIRKWIMLYNSDNPRGIVLRASRKPWGSWSSPMVIFDPYKDHGLGYFMHWPGHDSISELAPDGEEHKKVWGGEYAPYQIGPYSIGLDDNKSTKIYFVMSTWNPYQVVLMSAIIRDDDIVTG